MNQRKTLLLYVGANQGFGLTGLLYKERFDIVITFEPDPEMFQLLQENMKQGRLAHMNYPVEYHPVNAACSTEDVMQTIYIYDNRVSTSLGKPFYDEDKPRVIKTTEVRTVNLYNFLNINNIDWIDCLVTDCQGSDLNILKTIQPLIEEKKIGKIYHETHKNGYTPYVGLDNQFDGFKELLSKSYRVDYYSCDGTIRELTDNDLEWDTLWVTK